MAAVVLSFLLVSLPAAAQDIVISGIVITEDDTAAQIEAAIGAVEAGQGLDEETRTEVLKQLREAATLLQRKLNDDVAAERFAASLNTAPAQTDALRAMLDAQAPDAETLESLGIGDSVSLAELQRRLAKATADLTTVESELAEFRAQIETQVGRPAAVRERIAQLQKERQESGAPAGYPVVAGEPQILTNARRVSLQARRVARGAEINELEQELLSHAVRLNLLRAQRDVAARSQVILQRRSDLLRTALNERRELADIQAREAAIAAEAGAAGKHPVIRSLAEQNASLAVTLPKGANDIQEATAQLEDIRTNTRSLEQRLARSRQHVEIGGLSRTTGRLLIEQRRTLPQLSQYRPRSTEIAETGLALMFIEEQLRELTPLDDRSEQIMADVAADDLSEEELASIDDEIRQLLRSRRDLLFQAENNYRTYLQVLGDLDSAQRQLLNLAAKYEEFLNQSLLWIPSAPIAFKSSWADLRSALNWATDPDAWWKSFAVLVDSLREQVVAAVVFLLMLSMLLLVRAPLTSIQEVINKRTGRLSTDNIGLTIGSFVIAMVQALPVPLLLEGASWFLIHTPSATAFSDTLAQALSATAPFLFYTLVLRVLSAPDGVFTTHFSWNSDNVARVRRQLDRLAVVGAPLVFVTVFMFVSEDATDHTNLGRFMFVPLMVFLALIAHPLVHPRSGLAASYYNKQAESWISKFRWVWYALVVGTPLELALLSILGNVYTSTKLAGLFLKSIWFAVGLFVVYIAVLRWLALSRRKLELKILLQKREAQRAEKEAGADVAADGEPPVAAAEPLDFDAVDQQSRKLLGLGLVLVAAIAGWQIWSEVLPAFTLLEGFSLWSKTVLLDGVETVQPVTLLDLLLALLVVLVSIIASRNLPGFMEIALPQRLSVEPGSRYAINTLVRYFIIIIGAIVVLSIVGWDWSQIQWLVAALTVGLGFGLQEIVANFVSGLVILFERPVRVGDTVTVGQLSGTVSRIRIRATTITDWDRKEIIVPNKSFITEQVINWTLTDPITRIVIPVGVSYGSDVAEVHRVMEETLPTVPLVLDEPAPKVYFSGFGDSSLDFRLHVYLRQLTDRMPMVHEVHNAIFKALRENGIEIPFPQRDLHIRSTVEPPKT
jgi:potassium efflux system protein